MRRQKNNVARVEHGVTGHREKQHNEIERKQDVVERSNETAEKQRCQSGAWSDRTQREAA